ncbi:hypothetical protein WMW72_09885 [Paenibacillus filicis]|uniref:Uncharacterized protein n=1 Tax=Paenibacillus filicis TaxID=669464 RepID=A0ABU9DH55_9BACL
MGMGKIHSVDEPEQVISIHTPEQWRRRERELVAWVQRPKHRRRSKQTAMLGNMHIDAELLDALARLKRLGIETEFSCAGVSPLDEPEDHSLYAYVTLIASERADRFVASAMAHMRHRLLVTWEPGRSRYDLSSFYIGHNRSFCLLLQRSAEWFPASEETGG